MKLWNVLLFEKRWRLKQKNKVFEHSLENLVLKWKLIWWIERFQTRTLPVLLDKCFSPWWQVVCSRLTRSKTENLRREMRLLTVAELFYNRNISSSATEEFGIRMKMQKRFQLVRRGAEQGSVLSVAKVLLLFLLAFTIDEREVEYIQQQELAWIPSLVKLDKAMRSLWLRSFVTDREDHAAVARVAVRS